MAQQLRQTTIAAGEHPVPVIQIVVQLHVTQGCKAVEPGVSHLFHGLCKAMLTDFLLQFFPLTRHPGGPSHTIDDEHIPAKGRVFNACGGEPQLLCADRDSGDEVLARLWGEGLEVVFIHGCSIRGG